METIAEQSSEVSITQEYCDRVRKWQLDCYLAKISSEIQHNQNMCNHLRQLQWVTQHQMNQMQANSAHAAGSTAGTGPSADNQQQDRATGVFSNRPSQNYHIPPVWKRIVAELIDVCILFSTKLMIMSLFIEGYEEILQHLSLQLRHSSKTTGRKLGLRNNLWAFELQGDDLAEILIWTMAYRISACLFEGIFLSRRFRGQPGGCTPGKAVLGLRVVRFDEILALPEDRVQLINPRSPPFLSALIRGFIKNFSSAFMFPASFTIYLFDHHRPVYDIMCNTVVVERDRQGVA